MKKSGNTIGNKKKFEFPHVFVLLFGMIIIFSILTHFIPAGEFDRVDTDDGQTEIVEGTYHQVEDNPIGFFDIFQMVHKGMVEGSGIIAFILIIGGAFGVLNATKSIDTSLIRISEKMKGKEILIIPIVMTLFSLGGATFGMSEETIPFVLIFIPLALRIGYDSIVGVAMVLVGVYAGYAGAFLNPFTVGVAQGIAELPLFSGLGFRILAWVLFTGISIAFVMLYARKIKKDPASSSMHQIDQSYEVADSGDVTLLRRQVIIIGLFLLTIVGLAVGVMLFDWYIKEIAGLFLLMGIVAGIIYGMRLNQIAEKFVEGCKDIVLAAVSVGFAYGILAVLQESSTIDTVLNTISTWLSQVPTSFSAVGMYGVQAVMNFLVPSGSGQAALTMPIMTPLSDLAGVSRQAAVFAFQLGDAISNVFLPTSGIVMGSLAIARISWIKWIRWILPLLAIQYVLGAALLIVAHTVIWPS
ncbi:YfcC family protein [Barrientosiimonas marina]|uniref:YfcC family protein n=1 Tax=Lentibacillus kimchii TaxID=1542911 RepID=A0ABW2UX10_9BACI